MVDCVNPALPSQREVGEMTGQYNFSQVYATRARETTRTVAQTNAPR